MVNKSDLKDDANYYSQGDMEEIFVRGISALADKKEVTQVDLKNIGERCIGGGRPPLTSTNHKNAKSKGETFHHWYQMHHGVHPSEKGRLTFDHDEVIPPGNFFDCNRLADMWFQWFLTTPIPKNPYSNPGERSSDGTGQYGGENAFLMERWNTSAYFTTASAFQVPPDVKTITLLKEAPLLVPVYNVYVSQEMFPSLDDNKKLLVEVIGDLLGIIPTSVKAKLDGQTLEPCCVIRREPLRIPGIPIDNVFGLPKERLNESDSSINILHGGFWVLIRPEAITAGDHLLEWKVESVNYKIDAEIRINALV